MRLSVGSWSLAAALVGAASVSALDASFLTKNIAAAAKSAFLGADNILSAHDVSTVSEGSLSRLMSDLHSASGAAEIEFTHKDFPDHRVKIKETTGWCDPDVKSYSGYIRSAHDHELFFYFFESRSNPKEDPVLMWINGGPGCSSSLGLFMELGPCSISDPSHINGTKVNPYSWNSNANVFFLEQPIGVSYSFGKHGAATATTEQAAIDVQSFIAIFFETFHEFKGRDFYMSGESYGGRYLPVFASAVVDGNEKIVKKGKDPINLKGVLIGNGLTDEFKMQEAYLTYQCITLPGLDKPINSIGNCVNMAKQLPYINEQLERECLYRHDAMTCGAAIDHASNVLSGSFFQLGLNPYDVSKPCTREELAHGLCYGDITDGISAYLSLPELRKFLGVDHHAPVNFTSCSAAVGEAFALTLDRSDQTWLYVAGLLERGVEVISYVGTLDWICNFIGNEAWTDSLSWTGGKHFRAEGLREWTVDGKVAGAVKSHGGLTFATVLGAGHMVPYDKPAEALALLNRYMIGGGTAI